MVVAHSALAEDLIEEATVVVQDMEARVVLLLLEAKVAMEVLEMVPLYCRCQFRTYLLGPSYAYGRIGQRWLTSSLADLVRKTSFIHCGSETHRLFLQISSKGSARSSTPSNAGWGPTPYIVWEASFTHAGHMPPVLPSSHSELVGHQWLFGTCPYLDIRYSVGPIYRKDSMQDIILEFRTVISYVLTLIRQYHILCVKALT
ncbi:uncharacterized protein LOC136038918 isoform X1 [Artemia franciscana]|uniref:uncharacterized protein LOC136038918 isoform X1 n=1 Tax=Artemia franciscana TaxID=6661 RepID=UPI0032DA8448